jgi:hypothetical protein
MRRDAAAILQIWRPAIINCSIDIWLKAGRNAPKKARRIIQTSTSRAKIGALWSALDSSNFGRSLGISIRCRRAS